MRPGRRTGAQVKSSGPRQWAIDEFTYDLLVRRTEVCDAANDAASTTLYLAVDNRHEQPDSPTDAARISAAKKKAATSRSTPKAPLPSGSRSNEIGRSNALYPVYLVRLIPFISSHLLRP